MVNTSLARLDLGQRETFPVSSRSSATCSFFNGTEVARQAMVEPASGRARGLVEGPQALLVALAEVPQQQQERAQRVVVQRQIVEADLVHQRCQVALRALKLIAARAARRAAMRGW